MLRYLQLVSRCCVTQLNNKYTNFNVLRLNLSDFSNKESKKTKQNVTLSDAEWRKKLTSQQYRILRLKGTEYPGTGEYDKHFRPGIYKCAGCGEALYDSSSKFDSRCGWPAFSTSIGTSVRRQSDVDGYRVEILCASCDGHLGHVFSGEGLHDSNGNIIQERHCVNSASLTFEEKK